jgi:polysaccharide export outer membrane protein
MRNAMLAAAIAMLGLVAWTPPATAQDYVLGPEDVIQISVWMHPELERTVTIGLDSMITVPPLGAVRAAGFTPRQLGDRLSRELGSFLRQTTAATVTVVTPMSQSVYVSGAVAKPGRYGFERMPSLVDVISTAGGATAGAQLGRVQIIRREGENRRTIEADVASALRDGMGVPLPALRPGDTVVVPALAAPGATAPGEGVGVIGQVIRPGLYPVGAGGQDLWTVLAAAGGAGPKGDLSSVHVITYQGAGQAVVTVDLRHALKHGARAPFIVRSGDVVFVSSTEARGAGRMWAGFQAALGVSRDVLGLVLLRDIVNQ